MSDTGVGLPPDFELRKADGLGMNLAARLAKQLGGTLALEAGPPAAFTLTFALADTPTQP